jgi:2-hydroxy-4-carboxymuconate semialdehyde hemiacetal dehydrogenase
MKMRVAIIGCGAVASIHAANVILHPGVELTALYSPDMQSAESFAAAHRIPNISVSLHSAIVEADAVLICSPSVLHFEQARECLRAGRHTLIEFPACGRLSEAEELEHEAQKHGVLLGCAHTARYLEPYARIQSALQAGSIGEITTLSYTRYLQLRPRSWTDDVLAHHAAHAIDLVLQWCGNFEPLRCLIAPDSAFAQSVSILARLPGGGPLSITVSYGARLPVSQMVVVCTKHTLETDGFSYLSSDLEELQFAGEEREVYELAIQRQDAEFVGGCQGANPFVPWADTVSLIGEVNRLQAMRGS